MARPRKDSAGPAEHVTVRLTPTGIARLNALVAQYGLSRADVLERLLERAEETDLADARRTEKTAFDATTTEIERVRIEGAARDTEDMAELMQRRGIDHVPGRRYLDTAEREPDPDAR
jgi:hypothetical protein